MRLVHDACRAALALAALAAVNSGCGSSQPPSDPIGNRLDVNIRLVNCRDWRRSAYRERVETVRVLRRFAGGPSGSPAGHGTTLPDDKAYRLLDNHCKKDFARGFKLYKLYVRGADFQQPPEPR